MQNTENAERHEKNVKSGGPKDVQSIMKPNTCLNVSAAKGALPQWLNYCLSVALAIIAELKKSSSEMFSTQVFPLSLTSAWRRRRMHAANYAVDESAAAAGSASGTIWGNLCYSLRRYVGFVCLNMSRSPAFQIRTSFINSLLHNGPV